MFLSAIFKINSLQLFIGLYLVLVCVYFPKYLISPSSVILGYYALFYIIAPLFADRYSDSEFTSTDYAIAYFMAYGVLVTALFSSIIGERLYLNNASSRIEKTYKLKNRNCKAEIVVLYCMATSSLIAVVLVTGGFSYWISNPGDAFLNRGGSGVYYILSQFFTYSLAVAVGYYAFYKKKYLYILTYIIWLVITSPIHGSKGLVSFLVVLAFIPWLRSIRILSKGTVFLSSAFVIIFIGGLYYRNLTWLTLDNVTPYALNYFTVVSNLIISIKDFPPDFLTTFFLPFNKFLTPFGTSVEVPYYDMNHLLTDKYFPTAWAIRATEQWPVETDLYLNFYYIFGLPLIFFYFMIIGYVFGRAQLSRSVGMWWLSYAFIFGIIPHLRGSLYNHTDFYYYPMMYLIHFMFRKKHFPADKAY